MQQVKQKEEDAINAADGDGRRATAARSDSPSCASIDYDGIDNWQMSGGAGGGGAGGGGGDQMSRPRTGGRRDLGARARACVGLFKITKNPDRLPQNASFQEVVTKRLQLANMA